MKKVIVGALIFAAMVGVVNTYSRVKSGFVAAADPMSPYALQCDESIWYCDDVFNGEDQDWNDRLEIAHDKCKMLMPDNDMWTRFKWGFSQRIRGGNLYSICMTKVMNYED